MITADWQREAVWLNRASEAEPMPELRTEGQLPPYARQIELDATNDTVYIVVGGHAAWRRAKKLKGKAMVLPDGEAAHSYCWPVAGLGVIVLDYRGMDSTEAADFARLLQASGAQMVIHWTGEGTKMLFQPGDDYTEGLVF